MKNYFFIDTPLVALFFVPLLFYPLVAGSGWTSSSDVHALLELSSSLVAVTAGIMVLLHFFITGRWFFLFISTGFVQIGAEELIHAMFSFERFWGDGAVLMRPAISSTWLTGRAILLVAFGAAYLFGQREIAPGRRVRYAIACNVIAFACSASLALAVFSSPHVPGFVRLGTPSKQALELFLAAAFLLVFVLYYRIYTRQAERSPLLLGIVGCIVFQLMIHLVVYDSRHFYDAHWDYAHLLKLLGYFFPIFGVWGETVKIQGLAQARLEALEKEIVERTRSEQALAAYRDGLENLVAERTRALEASRAQAEAANRAKSVFLSNMSHELRTPLNAVIGFSRLVATSPSLSESERHNLAIINRAGKHLLTLIDDVLEISKIEAGHIRLHEAACDVREIAGDVIEMLRPKALQQGLTLSLVAEGVPALMRTDETKLRQVLINLLGNALKFTHEGGVTLTLRASVAPDGRTARIAFAVEDSGIGIAAADLASIFGQFVQLDTHASAAGTGLGLAISRQYVIMLGGELAVSSTLGQGATFSFCLNLALDDAVPAGPAGQEVLGLHPADLGKKILVVDDSADSRQLLRQLLAPLGFSVSEAADGEQAVAAAARSRPDLVIMDWRMPKLDGLAASQQIRAQWPDSPPRILICSASAFDEQREEARQAGIDGFLCKPLSEAQLYGALERALGIRFRRQAGAAPAAPRAEVALDLAELAQLPGALRAELRVTIQGLDPTQIDTVLAKVGHEHPQLAAAIADELRHFRHQELWDQLAQA